MQLDSVDGSTLLAMWKVKEPNSNQCDEHRARKARHYQARRADVLKDHLPRRSVLFGEPRDLGAGASRRWDFSDHGHACVVRIADYRSEERRVGKECRSR